MFLYVVWCLADEKKFNLKTLCCRISFSSYPGNDNSETSKFYSVYSILIVPPLSPRHPNRGGNSLYLSTPLNDGSVQLGPLSFGQLTGPIVMISDYPRNLFILGAIRRGSIYNRNITKSCTIGKST